MSSYTAAERRQWGKRLAKIRADQTEALHIASVIAQSAASEGVPETQIAADLGVDRMTVRRWVGKR